MKSWKLDAPGKLSLQETTPSVLSHGMVKVKVEEVLLSTSDIEIYKGQSQKKYPFVLGRNAVGVISEVYDKEKSLFQKLDRVAIEPYIPCNNCKECEQGDYEKCADMRYMGQNVDGLMQNFVDVSIDQVHRLPDNIKYEQALFVPYVSFCLNIVDALNLEKGRHVAIFASTKTGIILAQMVAYYQAVPILISSNAQLLESARNLGIFYCVNRAEVNVEKEILMITGGRMCHELVLFCDSDFSVKDVYDAAAVNANICLAGYSNKDSHLSISHICQKHLNIFGVYNGMGNFSSAINLLVTGTIKVNDFVGDAISFSDFDTEIAKLETADMALKSKVVKVD